MSTQTYEKLIEKLRSTDEYQSLVSTAIKMSLDSTSAPAAPSAPSTPLDSDSLLLDWMVGEYLTHRGLTTTASVLAAESAAAAPTACTRAAAAALLGWPLDVALGKDPMLYSLLAVGMRAGQAFRRSGAVAPSGAAPDNATDNAEAADMVVKKYL